MEDLKPPHPIFDDSDMDDDLHLMFTQGTRKALIKHMTKEGFPEDVKEQRNLLAALKDMDAQALSKKRISVEKESADTDAIVASALLEISKRVGNTNPFEGNRESPILIDNSAIPKPDLVPGETEIGVTTETYETFIKKFEE